MALQDVCGCQKSVLYPRRNCSFSSFMFSSDTSQYCYLVDDENVSWRAPFDSSGVNPLCLLLPPQQGVSQSCSGRSLVSPAGASTPRPFALSHGTTTLAFAFQGGVIAAADTRASCAGLIACPSAQKVTPIHSHLVVTSSGSGADCIVWERVLAREIRLYQLRYGRRLSVSGAAKLLALMLHPFKGTEVCVAATLCGWDGGHEPSKDKITHDNTKSKDQDAVSSITPSPSPLNAPENISARLTLTSDLSSLKTKTLVASSQADRISMQVSGNLSQNPNILAPPSAASPPLGPRVCYVCSDGLRLNGELISVGSGSPYAYSVLDDGWKWRMSVDEAVALAREAVYRATHRDAYSGNNVDLFHISACGWRRRRREDLKDEYYKEKRGKDIM